MELKKAILSQALREKRLAGDRLFDPQVFHASEAADCSRAIYLRRVGEPETRVYDSKADEARVEMLLADGRMHQAQLSGYIHRAPGVHLVNIERTRYLFFLDHVIVGSPDGIVHETKTEKTYVLEIKGLSRFVCKKMEDGNIDSLKEAYGQAIPQARIYSRMYNTDGIIILVKNKDTSEILQFSLDRDEKAETRILERFETIRTAIVAKKPPECSYVKGDWQCKFCPFSGSEGCGI